MRQTCYHWHLYFLSYTQKSCSTRKSPNLFFLCKNWDCLHARFLHFGIKQDLMSTRCPLFSFHEWECGPFSKKGMIWGQRCFHEMKIYDTDRLFASCSLGLLGAGRRHVREFKLSRRILVLFISCFLPDSSTFSTLEAFSLPFVDKDEKKVEIGGFSFYLFWCGLSPFRRWR